MTVEEAGSPNRREEGTQRRMPRSSERGGIHSIDLEIEHGGMIKTIGEMVSDLTTRHASYWHWHTLFSKVIRLYNSAKNEEGYGILLPNELTINGKSIGLLETEIENGVYDQDRLFKLVHIHEFLFIGD